MMKLINTRIETKHLHVASAIITAVSLAICANQPVAAGSPTFGAESKATIVAKKTKPLKAGSAVSSPEAGVQLLIRILQNIGNEPQIAMQKLDQAPSQQMFLATQNSLDPALVIRPQAKQMRRAKMSATKSDELIAMMPASRAKPGGYHLDGVSKTASPAEPSAGSAGARFNFSPNAYQPTGNLGASTDSRAESSSALSGKSTNNWGAMANNINKMYQATKFVEEITGNKKAESAPAEEMANIIADTESKVIRTGNYARGTTISSIPKITDYTKDSTRSAGLAQSQGIVDLRRGQAESPADNQYGGSDKTYARVDSPIQYRTMKEYVAEKEADLSGVAGILEKAKNRGPIASGGMHVAYLPPQLVSGIPGLRLGVPEAQVDSYLKNKGIVSKQKYNGWNVWSLQNNSRKTLLQIYLRNGTVEAFRVFDQAYVPEGLGVALNDKLETMKKKFGEPQFTLAEPTNTAGGTIPGKKNYVYPVNQVSFQLAREAPSDPVIVKSLLLFQFI